jgi:hypothetical protein
MYASTVNTIASNINVYPNPVSNTINLTINQNGAAFVTGQSALQANATTPGLSSASGSNSSYSIKIVNITGLIVKTASTTQATWQDSIGTLMPGTYVIQVLNSKDHSVVGKSTFIKL